MAQPQPVGDTSLFEASNAAFNSGDAEALLALYAEDCVWDLSRFPDGGVGADITELRRFLAEFRSFMEPWGGARAEIDQVLELDEDRVWLRGKLRFGSPSGAAELFDHFVHLVETRNGKVAEVTSYWDAEEARRDAGLDEVPT